MNSRNRYHGIDAYAVKLIRFKARQLSRLSCFGGEEIEDLEQELAMDLHRRISSFDPGRASKNTFIARVIENRAASLVTMATAPTRNGGQVDLSWEFFLESSHADGVESDVDASFQSSAAGSNAMEAAFDIGRCLQRLSKEQKRLCQLLPFHKQSAISQEMGWSRATFFRRVTSLRETFREAGLGNLFAAA